MHDKLFYCILSEKTPPQNTYYLILWVGVLCRLKTQCKFGMKAVIHIFICRILWICFCLRRPLHVNMHTRIIWHTQKVDLAIQYICKCRNQVVTWERLGYVKLLYFRTFYPLSVHPTNLAGKSQFPCKAAM